MHFFLVDRFSVSMSCGINFASTSRCVSFGGSNCEISALLEPIHGVIKFGEIEVRLDRGFRK